MTFLAVDGNSILNRAFYGVPPLSNKNGVYTNAITGFLNIFLKLCKTFTPTHIGVAFDLRDKTFRHLKYDGYKATRSGMPEELAMQLPLVKEILEALGIAVITEKGYEADDILGTLSRLVEENGGTCIISTGDRDALQLVSERTSVNLAKNKGDLLMTPTEVMEQYGVPPLQLIEVKALMGDRSDNIPGVRGVGEKSAFMLIEHFNNIEYIYNNIDSLDIKQNIKERLIKDKEPCFLSHFLGKICRDVPINTELDTYLPNEKNEQALVNIFSTLQMPSMMTKFSLENTSVEAREKAIAKTSSVDFVRHLTTITVINDKICTVSESGIVPIPEGETSDLLTGSIKKATFNLKALTTLVGYEINNVQFDTTLAAYLLDVAEDDYSFENLCALYNVDITSSNALIELNTLLYEKIEESGMIPVLQDIEIPLASVLVSMEKEGILLDEQALRNLGESLTAEMATLEEEIHTLAGEDFNISSPKQLGIILFEKLNLNCIKKKVNGYSTDAETLEAIASRHPIVPLILLYRTLSKLQSTYVTGLLREKGTDNRIHTTFKQTETATGRISSVEPNMQNIPVRTERGKVMRDFFIAKEGYLLVDADYSQIELRILAALSDDAIMKQAFIDGVDIHTATAGQVFNQPIDWVTKEMRSAAKAVNFGILYGMGAYTLAKTIKVPVRKASDYIETYLAKYIGISKYMEKTVAEATEKGYVTTFFGRRRYLPELLAKTKTLMALGKRKAMNSPIQGTAADIIKIAMIKVYKRLEAEKLPAKLILQIHDELIIEARADVAEKVAEILKEEMENAVTIATPLKADVGIGRTWAEAVN